jgi:hypothetical protein
MAGMFTSPLMVGGEILLGICLTVFVGALMQPAAIACGPTGDKMGEIRTRSARRRALSGRLASTG